MAVFLSLSFCHARRSRSTAPIAPSTASQEHTPRTLTSRNRVDLQIQVSSWISNGPPSLHVVEDAISAGAGEPFRAAGLFWALAVDTAGAGSRMASKLLVGALPGAPAERRWALHAFMA